MSKTDHADALLSLVEDDYRHWEAVAAGPDTSPAACERAAAFALALALTLERLHDYCRGHGLAHCGQPFDAKARANP